MDDFTEVRTVLTQCRENGASFDEAWPRALQSLPPIRGRGAAERRLVVDALDCTRGEWRRTYEGLPGSLPGLEALRLFTGGERDLP